MTLLEQCNADVYKAILDIRAKKPVIGEKMLSILQSHELYFDLTLSDVLWFSAHLPLELWDLQLHTFYLLFESQETTTMP